MKISKRTYAKALAHMAVILGIGLLPVWAALVMAAGTALTRQQDAQDETANIAYCDSLEASQE